LCWRERRLVNRSRDLAAIVSVYACMEGGDRKKGSRMRIGVRAGVGRFDPPHEMSTSLYHGIG
jgi:hypothetical protein